MERCSASLIKEMQIKTTARYYLLSKRQEITSPSKNVKKREHLCSISRNVNSCNPCGKEYRNSSKD